MGVAKPEGHILLQEFLAESFENLALMRKELIQYGQNPDKRELINSIYRKIHTFKGSSGLIGLENLVSACHAFEMLLEKARGGKIRNHRKVVDLLLKAVDVLFRMTMSIKKRKEGETAHLCGFKVGDYFCALPVSQIQEVSPPHVVTPIPLAPDHINGLIRLRGRIVMDIGMRKLLEMDQGPKKERVSMIVQGKKSLYSLEVDEVFGVVEVCESMEKEMPRTIKKRIKYFVDRVYKFNDKSLMTLKLDKVLDLKAKWGEQKC